MLFLVAERSFCSDSDDGSARQAGIVEHINK